MSAELDVIHDDEAIEQRHQRGDLREAGFEQEVVGLREDVAVALDAALRVEDEVVAALPGGEVADGVCDHAVEPADAVRAGDPDPAGICEGDETGGGEQRCELALRGDGRFGKCFPVGLFGA